MISDPLATIAKYHLDIIYYDDIFTMGFTSVLLRSTQWIDRSIQRSAEPKKDIYGCKISNNNKVFVFGNILAIGISPRYYIWLSLLDACAGPEGLNKLRSTDQNSAPRDPTVKRWTSSTLPLQKKTASTTAQHNIEDRNNVVFPNSESGSCTIRAIRNGLISPRNGVNHDMSENEILSQWCFFVLMLSSYLVTGSGNLNTWTTLTI